MTPAERKLAGHLTLLQETPDPPASLTERVLRTARWQQSVRSPLLALTHVMGTVADAFRLLLGGRS